MNIGYSHQIPRIAIILKTITRDRGGGGRKRGGGREREKEKKEKRNQVEERE